MARVADISEEMLKEMASLIQIDINSLRVMQCMSEIEDAADNAYEEALQIASYASNCAEYASAQDWGSVLSSGSVCVNDVIRQVYDALDNAKEDFYASGCMTDRQSHGESDESIC